MNEGLIIYNLAQFECAAVFPFHFSTVVFRVRPQTPVKGIGSP